MKNEYNKKYGSVAVYTVVVIVVSALILMFLFAARDFFINKQYTGIFKLLQPFIMGLIIAYLLNPLVNVFDKKVFHKLKMKNKDEDKNRKLRRTLSIFSTFLIAVIVLGLLLLMVIPQIGTSINQLTNIVLDLFSPADSNTDHVVESVFELENIENTETIDQRSLLDTKIGVIISDLAAKTQDTITNLGLNLNIEETFNDLILTLTANIATLTKNIVQPLINQTAAIIYSTATGVLNVFLAIIISIYVLTSKEVFSAQTKKLLFSVFPVSFTYKFIQTSKKTHEIIGGFITGKILDSLIIGIICFVCMSIFGINYAMLISVIVGITNVIPFFGPFIGAIPSIFFLLFIDPWQAVWFLVFVLILQQVDGNIIGPKILSSAIGLSSFWIIFAIIIMGNMFGIFGMFFGVPMFAVIYLLVKEFIENRLKKKGFPTETADYIKYENTDTEVVAKDTEDVKSISIFERVDSFVKKVISPRQKHNLKNPVHPHKENNDNIDDNLIENKKEDDV